MKEDLLIVGSGVFGSTFANLAKAAGKSVRIIDKSNWHYLSLEINL